jgi:HPr kinase/phosphorylase
MLLHASCAARGSEAVLLLGPPGSGKSDLLLRLLGVGWLLVADDQVAVEPNAGQARAAAPAALAGRLEVRGLGLFEGLPTAASAALRLAVRLVPRPDVARLPRPVRFDCAGVALPLVALHAFEASAPAKIALALDAAQGRARQSAGAFAVAA